MTTFVDDAVRVRALSNAGDVAGALRLLEEVRPRYPRQSGQIYLLEAELMAGRGDGPAALAPLEQALASGCHYKKEWLLGNKALAPLAELPAMRALVERAQRAYDEAAASAKPHLTFAMPDTLPDAFGYPLLMVLHGNNSNAKRTAERWSGMADRGWVVAVPQSSEVGMSPDAYTWNDRERVATELDLHFDRVKRATEIDSSRIILAGFSMGATQAIALALTKRFPVPGFLAIAPWLPRIDEFRGRIEGGAAKMLRSYVVIGDADPSLQGSRDLVAVMQQHNIRAKLDERPGLGHDYPEDIDATLVAALEFVTK